MTIELAGISSMATKHVLAELVPRYLEQTGQRVTVSSMGGVEAAAHVRSEEPCDFAVLALDVLRKLEAEGHVAAGSHVDVARSAVAVAVKEGAPAPDISTESALRAAVANAKSIGYSTGPSGAYLLQLFERWGVLESIKPRLKQAPSGVPVGTLVARGEVALGFQQLSELIHLDGIRIVGPLPSGIQTLTTFSAGVCARSANADAARAFLAFLATPKTEACKRKHGMEPA